jgi:hypothetical protein
MIMNNNGIVLFHTSSSAIQAELLLKRAKFFVKLVPTPREYSSDCGIALRFDVSDSKEVQFLLEVAKVEISRIVVRGNS